MAFRYTIGMCQPSSSLDLSDRYNIVQSMATHYSIVSVKAELDQFVDGLRASGVLELFQKFPTVMRPTLLCKEPLPLTSDHMIDLFEPIMSISGSNRREEEEAIVLKWINYLQLIEGEVLY